MSQQTFISDSTGVDGVKMAFMALIPSIGEESNIKLLNLTSFNHSEISVNVVSNTNEFSGSLANEVLEITVNVSVYIGKFDYYDGDSSQQAFDSLTDDILNIFIGDPSMFDNEINKYTQLGYGNVTNRLMSTSDSVYTTLVHSPVPSSMPTSMPTCSAGNIIHNENGRTLGK